MSSRSEDAALAAPTTTEVYGSTSERTRALRGRIAPEQGYVEKKRRALRCPETDFTHITPAISDAIFFKLPRELRDSVYQFLWVDMRIWQRYKKNFFILTYGDQGDMDSEENSTYGKAPWLLSCKQMLVEGLAEFHRRSVWIFESWDKSEKPEYVFPLITPALVHEQHLYVDGIKKFCRETRLRHYGAEQMRQSGLYEPAHLITLSASTVGLVDLMTVVSDNHKVQKVKIILRIYDDHLRYPADGQMNWNHHHIPNIMFDLSAFERLAAHSQLQILEVETTVFKEKMIQNCVNLDIAISNLMTEVDAVGKAIMPGGKVVQTDSASGWPLVSGPRTFTFMVGRD